jgi:hypothetical protein
MTRKCYNFFYRPPKLIYTFPYAQDSSLKSLKNNLESLESLIERSDKRMKIQIEYSNEEALRINYPAFYATLKFMIKDHNDRVTEMTEPEWQEYCRQNIQISQEWIAEQHKWAKVLEHLKGK